MNERVRMNEQEAQPVRRAGTSSQYYFPPSSYPQHPADTRRQPRPQAAQQPSPAPREYQSSQGRPSAATPDPDPADMLAAALAQIAARQRFLDDPNPFPPEPVLPQVNFGHDPYTPPYQAPFHVPQQPPHAVAPPIAPKHPEPPAPDLSRLEGQLRQLTAQLETLRVQPPDFSAPLKELRQDLADISKRLNEALPRRAVEALENEVRRLADRIDHSRIAGADPQVVAGMERTLNEVRDALRSLKPAESLAGFEAAIRNLAERMDQAGSAYQDAQSLQQLESAITALRAIVANVASNETLAGLAGEVRGLSAKVDRVASVPPALDPEALHSLEQRIASLPVLTAIERGFSELSARLDSLHLSMPQPAMDGGAAADHLKRDLLRTQDSLEAVHSTLGHLVDRLALIEGGIREARLAAEAPRAPAAGPGATPADPMASFMRAAMAETAPASASPSPAPSSARQVQMPAFMAAGHETANVSEAAPPAPQPDKRPVPTLAAAVSEPPPPPKPKGPPPQMRERQPIDPNLPPDYPLEPGSGAPRARPGGSAAERIAASEAALGAAKPGGANHPGQTNFIAAARRAAQAAVASNAEGPATAAGADAEPRSIGQRMRSLIAGAGVIVLVLAGTRIALDMIESDNLASTEMPVSAQMEPAARPENTGMPKPNAAPVLAQPQNPDAFASPAAGVIMPERPAARPAAPQPEIEATGSTANRASAPASAANGPLPPLNEKLPPALRAAALKGQPSAAYEIGIRLLEGKAVPHNNEEALRWLERAAQAGLAPAHFRLGGIYEKGLGVKKNPGLARSHYLAAAEKGNAKAMHNLAVLYAEGIEGKPDYKTAADWFQRAAEHGVADSQYNLAILYARGIGVGQNLPESYKWFALAALQGDQDAAKKRDEVGAKLNAASLSAAKAAVQGFTALVQPDDAVTVAAPPGGWDKPAADSAAPARKPRPGTVARVTAS